MIVYKDQSFCNIGHLCKHRDGCQRYLTEYMIAEAEAGNWCLSYCGSCEDFEREESK
jgi:hypothetical protein